MGAALHWLLIRTERGILEQVLVLHWPGWPSGNLLYRSLTACPALLGVSLAATWQLQAQLESRGWGERLLLRGISPAQRLGAGWQVQPKQLGCLANVSLLLKGCRPFGARICKKALAQLLKTLAVSCPCSSGLLIKIEFCMCMLFQRQFSRAEWAHSCPVT